jgi:hypothetical protein
MRAEIEKVRNLQLKFLLHLRLRTPISFEAFVVKVFSVEASKAESRTVSSLPS